MQPALSSRFQPSRFVKPRTEDVVARQLKQDGHRARVVAGGTGIYELAGRELLADVETLVDISGLGLSYVREEGGWMTMGATTTMAELLRNRGLLKPGLAALHDAILSIQPLQVKNVATVGGAICTALPFFDMPVALMALDSRVVIAPSGRSVPLNEFIRGYFDVDLSPGEFVREVKTRIQNASGSAFLKFATTSDDWAIANCAVRVLLERDTLANCHVVFGGGFGAKPARATSIEKALTGSKRDEGEVRKAFEENLSKDLEPVSDVKASAEYRMHLAAVLGRRTFMRAMARARGSV
jgi:aerobic carbon-monoxide dehydrogenase medium subunit